MAKILEIVEKAVKNLPSFTSHMHSLYSIVRGFLGDQTAEVPTTDKDGRLQAHETGKGQADERLTLSACARAINRMVKDYCRTSPQRATKNQPIKNREDAESRMLRVIRVINSYTPLRRRNIILTIGLEQDVYQKEVSQGKDNDGKEKPPKIITEKENKSGQDILIMLALRDESDFTREMCDIMCVSNDLGDQRIEVLKRVEREFAAFLGQLNEKLSEVLPKEALFSPPIWTDFILIEALRKKIVAGLEKSWKEENGYV